MPEKNEEMKRRKEECFSKLPVEFQQFCSYHGHDRGHSAGEYECDLIAGNVAFDLIPVVKSYTERIYPRAWLKQAVEALQLAGKDHSKGCGCKVCQCLETHPKFD